MCISVDYAVDKSLYHYFVIMIISKAGVSFVKLDEYISWYHPSRLFQKINAWLIYALYETYVPIEIASIYFYNAMFMRNSIRNA